MNGCICIPIECSLSDLCSVILEPIESRVTVASHSNDSLYQVTDHVRHVQFSRPMTSRTTTS